MTPIRFAAVGFAHNHLIGQTNSLLKAGAELVWFWDADPAAAATFLAQYPQAKLARDLAEILEDTAIDLVVSAAVPDQRAALGMRVLAHGKDYLSAKPGFTSLEQLAAAQQQQAETGQKWLVYFGERFGNPATVQAGALVQAGAIGTVLQTVGFGPHRLLGHGKRQPWSFDRPRFGGILNDLASHQIDQFLFFTGCTAVEIVAARTSTNKFHQFPDFEDFGELLLRGGQASGYIRVDWLTPDGLPTWGDVRLFVLGTEGSIELRKNIDLHGRVGGNHLFLTNQQGVRYLACEGEALPFAGQLLQDIRHRTETAVGQQHTFTVCRLALEAQQLAHSLENPKPG